MTRRGFTLVEMLVATALMLVLVGAMYGFLHDLVSVRARVFDLTARQRAADALIETLEQRLACAIVADARGEAGVRGDADGIRVLARGVSARAEGDEPALTDLQILEVRYDRDAARLDASTTTGDPMTLGPLGDVRLRYRDDGAWAETFDSAGAGRLPEAVEVSVWITTPAAPRAGAEPAEPDRRRLILVPDAETAS